MFLSLPGTPHGNAVAQTESTNAHILKLGLQFSPSAHFASKGGWEGHLRNSRGPLLREMEDL